jgi:hypothetical protein
MKTLSLRSKIQFFQKPIDWTRYVPWFVTPSSSSSTLPSSISSPVGFLRKDLLPSLLPYKVMKGTSRNEQRLPLLTLTLFSQDVFHFHQDYAVLNSALKTPEQKTTALNAMAQDLKKRGMVKAWRGI